MKRLALILTVGIMLAVAGFASTYVISTAHSLERSPKPELVWLKQEYQLYTKLNSTHNYQYRLKPQQVFFSLDYILALP